MSDKWRKDAIGDRLGEVLGSRSVREFARGLGLIYTTVRGYFLGRKPSGEFLARLQEEEHISPLWVMTGRGPKYILHLRETVKVEDRAAAIRNPGAEEGDLRDRIERLEALADKTLRLIQRLYPELELDSDKTD